MRRLGQWVMALGLSAFCLWLAFRHVRPAEVRAALSEVSPGGVVAYALGLAGVQVCRAWRWRVLVRPVAPLSAWQAFRVSNIGTLFIMLMPLRLGELVRPAIMQRDQGTPFAASLAAVAVERVLDGLVVTLLFFVAAWGVSWPRGLPTQLAWAAAAAAAIFVAASAALVATWLARAWVARTCSKLVAAGLPVGRLVAILRAFVGGIGILPSWGALAQVVGWTAAYWGCNALGLWALIGAFGWTAPFLAAAALVSMLCIGIMLPAGPGFLGTYQAALVLGLGALDIGATASGQAAGDGAAAAFAMCAYAANLAVVVAFGLPHVLLGDAQGTASLSPRRGPPPRG